MKEPKIEPGQHSLKRSPLPCFWAKEEDFTHSLVGRALEVLHKSKDFIFDSCEKLGDHQLKHEDRSLQYTVLTHKTAINDLIGQSSTAPLF